MDGVVKVVTPVPLVNTAPPVVPAYQSIVEPEAAVAAIDTVPEPHTDPPVAPVGAAGNVLTVAVTDVRVEETQPVVEFLDWA